MKKILLTLPLILLVIGLGIILNTESEGEKFIASFEEDYLYEELSEIEKYVVDINEIEPADASWVTSYQNFDEMYQNADLIVVGEVVKNIPEQRHDMIFTHQVIDIQKVLKGKKLKQIEVLITGGKLNGIVTPTIEDANLLSTRSEYVLFLEETSEDHYLIMGGIQGYGKIKDGEFVLKHMNKDKVRSVKEVVEKSK